MNGKVNMLQVGDERVSKELLWTFPVTIQSLFEGKSTGVLRTIKPITDTVIIQLFKSVFILKIYSILFYGIVH